MIDLDVIGSSTGVAPMTLSGDPVSGIRLLGQRVLILLLSNVSELLRDDEGSTLINALGSGTYDDEYTRLFLYSAIYRVLDILKADTNKYPDDETIRDINVDTVKMSGDVLDFTISVTSMSGDNTAVTAQTGAIYGY